MSRTQALKDLQTLDQQRAQVAARLSRVEARLAAASPVAAAEAAAGAAKAARDDIDRQLRACQAERAALKEHIAGEERQLYGGQVKAPKELQNLQREIDGLRRRLSELDDRALEAMVARDEAEAGLEAARRALAEAEASTAAEGEALRAERAKLLAARQRLEPARSRAAAAVPAADLAVYERLWRQQGGRPLAPLTGDHCGACGMQVPRHVQDQVLTDQGLIHCGHCGRILHPPG